MGFTSASIDTQKHRTPADLIPRKILLVEDNPVNQKVAVGLLSRRGHSIEVAHNGAEAVDAVARQPFDVVLMDVHMPVMDGLAATRIIRQREHASGSHVPIVALSAGATVEDRENCLSAGMDNFISKPFRADELFQVVEGVPAEALVERPMDDGGDPAQPASLELCLDWPGALRNLEGDEDFLYELSEMYLTQCPALLVAVEEAVSREDGEELRRAAHALKGSSLVIGGQATAAAALLLENLGRGGSVGEAVSALHSLQGDLAELTVALLAALQKRDA